MELYDDNKKVRKLEVWSENIVIILKTKISAKKEKKDNIFSQTSIKKIFKSIIAIPTHHI